MSLPPTGFEEVQVDAQLGIAREMGSEKTTVHG